MRKFLKIALLALAVLIVNVFLFSDSFLGITLFEDSTFITAIGITEIILSGVVFIYVFLKVVNEEEKINIDVEKLETEYDYRSALTEIKRSKTYLSEKIDIAFDQLKLMDEKLETLKEILKLKEKNRFEFYMNEAKSVQKILDDNIKKLLIRFMAVDRRSYMQKDKPINISIDKILRENDEFLVKFGTFVEEVSMQGDKENSQVGIDAAISALRQMRNPENNFFNN